MKTSSLKRTAFTLLLALALGLSAAAQAATYSLDYKLLKQLQDGSGLNATAAFSVIPGKAMTALDRTTNALLSSLLPQSTLDLRYIQATGRNSGKEELALTLKRAGNELGRLHYVSDGAMESLQSTLLGPDTYAAVRGDLLLGGLFNQQTSAWPGMGRVLYALSTGDNDFNTRGNAAIQVHLSRLSAWLQPFSKVETVQNSAGKTVSRTTVILPADQTKAGVKQLLEGLYADPALLGLLREKLTPRETAAYLDPGMKAALFTAVDTLTLSGPATLQREYNADGTLAQNNILLPMGGAYGIDTLEIRYTAGPQSEMAVLVKYLPVKEKTASGRTLEVRYTGGAQTESPDSYQYQGEVIITPEAGFTVGDQASGRQQYAFTLNAAAEAEVVDAANESSSRDYQITLLLRPQHNETLSEQKIQLQAQLKSRNNTRSATTFSGKLVWEDMQSGAAFTADISGNSAAPWNIPAIDLGKAIRLDTLDAAGLAALKTKLQQTLQAGVQGLVQQVIPKIAP